jgi:hypothetical protein
MRFERLYPGSENQAQRLPHGGYGRSGGVAEWVCDSSEGTRPSGDSPGAKGRALDERQDDAARGWKAPGAPGDHGWPSLNTYHDDRFRVYTWSVSAFEAYIGSAGGRSIRFRALGSSLVPMDACSSFTGSAILGSLRVGGLSNKRRYESPSNSGSTRSATDCRRFVKPP